VIEKQTKDERQAIDRFRPLFSNAKEQISNPVISQEVDWSLHESKVALSKGPQKPGR
jgi:hypothetical protein